MTATPEAAKDALDLTAYRAALASYRQIVVAHIANALVCDSDVVHGRACDLAKALDQAGLNVDYEVDEHIDRHCEITAREAWKPPSVRREERDAALQASAPF